MSSAPEYIAERSVWWEEGVKAVIRRLHLSKQVFHCCIIHLSFGYDADARGLMKGLAILPQCN